MLEGEEIKYQKFYYEFVWVLISFIVSTFSQGLFTPMQV